MRCRVACRPVHDETTCYLRPWWTRFVTNNPGNSIRWAAQARTIHKSMRLLAALLMAFLLSPALAQHGHRGNRDGAQRPMPAPERRMGWEDRQRLREQVRNGQMTRDEARQR